MYLVILKTYGAVIWPHMLRSLVRLHDDEKHDGLHKFLSF